MIDAAKHFLLDASRIVGLRDRLRCPKCSAVGTYKPHGGLFDREDTRKVRRWMCKWCGYYRGPEGERRVYPDPATKCWELGETDAAGVTPAEGWSEYCRSVGLKVWPWRG